MKTTSVKKEKASSNQAISKGLQLIVYMSQNNSAMRLQDIAELSGMPQATVLRYLSALQEDGYVYQDTLSGRYGLTWKIAAIGHEIQSRTTLRSISSDIIMQLYDELTLGICLVIEHEMECMYLDCYYKPDQMGMSVMRIGNQTPMSTTSSGKVILSDYPEADVNAYISQKGLAHLTDHSITDHARFLAELENVRRNGYAIDDEECEDNLKCVAVPIYDYNGKVAAAVSAFGTADKMHADYIQQKVLPELKKASEAITFRMGGTAPAQI